MKEKLQKIREHAMAEIENSDGLAKLNDVLWFYTRTSF